MTSQSGLPDGKRADLHGKAIAVIDDDIAVCVSTRLLLEVYGIDVLTYQSGGDFLRDRPNVDCVIVDYQMPGMNGLEFISELRKQGLRLPAIIITATTDPTVEHRAVALGIRQVLRKPLANRVLLDAIGEELPPLTTALGAVVSIPSTDPTVVAELNVRLPVRRALEAIGRVPGCDRGSPSALGRISISSSPRDSRRSRGRSRMITTYPLTCAMSSRDNQRNTRLACAPVRPR